MLKVIFIICIAIIEFILDYKQEQCFNRIKGIKKILLYLNLFIHHLISSFILFGWIFNNKYILYFYICYIIILILLWNIIPYISFQLFKKKNTGCILTILKNKLCNDNLLKPFYTFLSIFKVNNFGQYLIIFNLIIIGIIKLIIISP